MPLTARPLIPTVPSEKAGGGFLQALRRTVAALERKGAALEEAPPGVHFGLESVDAALGDGLAQGALHELAAASEPEIAAASGFTLALAARCARAGAVLWIGEDRAAGESGRPYGLGLDEIGLSPERLVWLTAARPRDVAWAMEEALRCRAVSTVVGELRTARGIDDVAARRLSLAAASCGGLAFLLLAHPPTQASPAATRWIVSAASSMPTRHGLGPPRIGVQLVRNRYGRLGSWLLEWNCVEQRFQLASAHPEPLARASADRPHRAAYLSPLAGRGRPRASAVG